MNEKIWELIWYRIERSREMMKDARTLADSGGWNSCINRLYYSCFYAVTALLLSRGFSSAKHTGVRSLLNKHIVKTGLLSTRLGDLYNTLYESRHQSDYVDLRSFQADEVLPLIGETSEFIHRVFDLIDEVKK